MVNGTAFTHAVAFVNHAMAAARALAGAAQRTSVASALRDVSNLLVRYAMPRSSEDFAEARFAAASTGQHHTGSTSAEKSIDPSTAAHALAVVIDHELLNRSGQFSLPDKARLALVNKASHEQLAYSLANQKESRKLTEEAKSVSSVRCFVELCKDVESLMPEWRNEPLNVLGRRIPHLPKEDQLLAIVRFKEAVDSLPDRHRHGLLGMYEVAKSKDVNAFSEWKKHTTNAVIQDVLKTDARYSQSARNGIAERFGLTGDARYRDVSFDRWSRYIGGETENRSRRGIEEAVLKQAGCELLKQGVSAEETLRKLDLGNYAVDYRWDDLALCWRDVGSFWEGWWSSYLEDFHRDAFSVGPAKLDMIAGNVDYLFVAEKHGLRGDEARNAMVVYYEAAHRDPLEQPALDDLLAGQPYDVVAQNHGITSSGLIARMKEAAGIISSRVQDPRLAVH